jgi:predicted dehydrogenase
MKTSKIGVIGAGGCMGNMFTKIISEMRECSLVALSEVDKYGIERLMADYKVPVFENYQEMIESVDMDGIIICLPEDMHTDAIRMSIRRGLNVFVEKPLADNSRDCRSIIDENKTRKVKIVVGHTLRFDYKIVMAKDAIDAGEIGDVVYIYARRNNNLENLARIKYRTTLEMFLSVHDIDAMRWITKSEVKSVYASANSKLLKDRHINDVVLSTFKFENGSIGILENSWIHPTKNLQNAVMMDIFGTKGCAHINQSPLGLEIYSDRENIQRDYLHFFRYGGRQEGVYKQEMVHFVNCIVSEEKPIVDEYEATKSVIVAEAITESIKTGREVRLQYDSI